MRLSLLFVTLVLGGCASTTSSTHDSPTQRPEATDQIAPGGRDGDSEGQRASSIVGAPFSGQEILLSQPLSASSPALR